MTDASGVTPSDPMTDASGVTPSDPMTDASGVTQHDPVAARRAVLLRRQSLLAAAHVFSCAVMLGVLAGIPVGIVAGVVAGVFGLGASMLVPFSIPLALNFGAGVVLASASGGAGAAAGLYVARTHGRGVAAGAVGIAWGSALGGPAGLLLLWLGVTSWRPLSPAPSLFIVIGALLWLVVALSVGIGAGSWAEWRARRTVADHGASRRASLGAVAIVVVAIGVLVVSMVVATGTPADYTDGPPVDAVPVAPPRDQGFPDGESPTVGVPSLEEAHHQFAALAEATVAAAGPDAIWRDDPALAVIEVPCESGVLLQLDGEFAMGAITDTSSDEHDREVTDDNLSAAQRIGVAWRELGLGASEPLHGEQHFGGGTLSAVDHAVVAFDFGVAQPRVEGRCLPIG